MKRLAIGALVASALVLSVGGTANAQGFGIGFGSFGPGFGATGFGYGPSIGFGVGASNLNRSYGGYVYRPSYYAPGYVARGQYVSRYGHISPNYTMRYPAYTTYRARFGSRCR